MLRRRIGDVTAPLFHRLVEGRFRPARTSALANLMRTQYWELDRIRELQQDLLRRLLSHASRASTWYRERLSDVPDAARFALDDLDRLPILERRDLQEHLDDIAGSGRSTPDVQEAFSSGSSGAPVRVYQSQEFRDWVAADFYRSYLMCTPFRLGMPRAFLWGSRFDLRRHTGVAGTARDLLFNTLWFVSPTRDRIAETLQRLRAFRPSLVVGYVSSLIEVANALDLPLDGLGSVETAAEALAPAQRALIAQRFGAPVFDRYASREVGPIAHECDAHDGLHVNMENVILEVVDASGHAVKDPGSDGEVVVTSLRNLAAPLIRYRLGDIARLSRGACACGRGSARIASLRGRTIDVIVTPGGVLLHGEFFTRLFQDAPVRKFRVDQETTSRLRVQVVPAATYGDDVRRRLTSVVLSDGDPAFDIVWEVVDDIPVNESGKFRFIVNHLRR